ncbi:M16 family metallopeptidase [Planctomicrobium piriforme]|uniref:Predicted Zn-dependent peptidase n=1 Tax=Planctomicrobium piriforme TaxID=1576369 RepID=A0A1I3HHP4_9PLAN|nr:pitrilysin family protein [Planctomicrobium piriforme]SFI35298.1 Predicted Zn-dependent peptidase [Planctomicrobium piriforme]
MTPLATEVFELGNGLTLLVEPMPHVQSAAFSILTPAGVIYEPAGQNGVAAALCDMMTRGAGGFDSRQLSAALDNLGVQRSENVGWNFITFSGATLADNLLKVFPIYARILREPLLDPEQFPAVMSGVEQGLLAEEDEPQRKALTELRRHCYDAPWNRPVDGTLAELDAITPDSVSQFYRSHLRPNGTLIGVAGNVDPRQVRDVVAEMFGDWEQMTPPTLHRVPGSREYRHIDHASTQTHIGLAYNAVPYGHADYYAAWAAVSVLSGGSSSRLFTEVREKRGLCYSVYATLHSLLTEGRVLAYAGATTDRAQETLNVMVEEMRRLSEGVEPDELRRCQARAKSSLIMQQESTGARASSIARDWFHLKKINTLADVRAAVESLTIEEIAEYARRFPARDLTVLTIGAEPLQVPQD